MMVHRPKQSSLRFPFDPKRSLIMLSAAALLALPLTSFAQYHGGGPHGGGGGYAHGGGGYGGGYGHAPGHGYYGHPGWGGHYPGAGGWHGGYWYHGGYGGTFGWWWVGGGDWYLYPAPIYPYPDYSQPPQTVMPGPAAQQPEVAAAPQYWYWCSAPQGYYPNVDHCSVAWQAQMATPPPPSPQDDSGAAAEVNAAPNPNPQEEAAPGDYDDNVPQAPPPGYDPSAAPLQPMPQGSFPPPNTPPPP